MIIPAEARIYNVPDYAKDYEFWIVRFVDGHLWFFGAWDDEERARSAIKEIENGMVVRNIERKEK